MSPTRAAGVLAAIGLVVVLLMAANEVISQDEQRIIEREALTVAEVAAVQVIATRRAFESTSDGHRGGDAFVDAVAAERRRLGPAVFAARWLPIAAAPPETLDAFLRSAWRDLAAPAADRGVDRPVARWAYGEREGQRHLRYMRAAEEGFVEVTVPIEEATAFAALQVRSTQALLVVVGMLGFALVTGLSLRSARQQRGLARQFEQLAMVDRLTGLANRLALEERMRNLIAEARRDGEGFGVVFIDIDNFKTINDSLGHQAGDTVLRVTAERMAAALRDSDVIARYSGDEFLVLTRNVCEAKHLALVASKLLESAAPVVRVQEHDIFVTLSMGIARFPDDGEDVQTLLKHADSAMYRAKDKGRNGFQFFAAEMNRTAVERLQMSSSLWHALNREEFVVYYQPKAEARAGRIVGFEALVRWRHPELGVLGPDRFIPHAESSGAIEPLGEWVLSAALAQLRAWRDRYGFEGTMAVNLSMRQLYNPSLPAMVRRSLEEQRIDPGLLELEVTESMVSANPEMAASTLGEIGRMGVSIALDDFGTGQSSLSWLLRFPIGTLKIDRSFTADVPNSEDACSIVRAIIALARGLRLRLVAEGVETEPQRSFFEHEGCDEIQGYLIGHPVPASRAEVHLHARRRARSMDLMELH